MWVLLMVPVAAFAAVVALAGPRRVAAESSMEEMAEDLAVFAVAARNNGGDSAGPLPVFPPNCHTYLDAQIQAQKTRLTRLMEGSATPTTRRTKQGERGSMHR